MLVDKDKSKLLKKIEENIHLFNRKMNIIDKGLLIRKSQLDMLALDNFGKLILIEVERTKPDNLISKALEHLNWILHNMRQLQNKYRSYNVDCTVIPEIILMSERIPEDIQRRVAYIKKCEFHLFEFDDLEEGDIRIEPLQFNSRASEMEKDDMTMEEIIAGINSEKVKKKCRLCVDFINSLKNNLELSTEKGIIQFNHEGSYFAAIYPFENFFWINLNPEYWSGRKISENTNLSFNSIIS